MTERTVLFLCTGNSARSIMAEAILNRLGHGRFQAFSAGSHPKGEVHPLTVRLLQGLGYETAGLRSKSWDEFAAGGARHDFDLVITVCDDAAGEACPLWPGTPAKAHWGIPDPAAGSGSPSQKADEFSKAYRLLKLRIERLLTLPLESLDGPALKAKLAEIGHMEGATEKARAE
jgi:protein-tyrosine-phosphatase